MPNELCMNVLVEGVFSYTSKMVVTQLGFCNGRRGLFDQRHKELWVEPTAINAAIMVVICIWFVNFVDSCGNEIEENHVSNTVDISVKYCIIEEM